MSTHRIPTSSRRKTAIALFSPPSDGNLYAKFEARVDGARRWLRAESRRRGEPLPLTALVAVAMGRALAAAPECNRSVSLGGLVQHDRVNVSVLVLKPGGDLGFVLIEDADRRDLIDVSRALAAGARAEQQAPPPAIDRLPTPLLRLGLRLAGLWCSQLGRDLPALGLRAFPMGSAVLSPIGAFGLEEAFAPRTRLANVPMNLVIGATRTRVILEAGVPVESTWLPLCANLDHRVGDAVHFARAWRAGRPVIEDPAAAGVLP